LRRRYAAFEAAGIRMVHAEKIAAFKVGDANNDGRMVFDEFRRVALKFTKLTAKHQPAIFQRALQTKELWGATDTLKPRDARPAHARAVPMSCGARASPRGSPQRSPRLAASLRQSDMM
jgi:hypothetical protein